MATSRPSRGVPDGQKQKLTCGAQMAPLRTSEPREKISSPGQGLECYEVPRHCLFGRSWFNASCQRGTRR
jgi:hypothetical protein